MPRIHTITTDTVISDNDLILGTDGAQGANNATKNFSFGVFKNYLWTNVTFTGDLNVSGGDIILDNNKFLQSKLTNGTVIDLIGINGSNLVKIAQDNQAVTFGQGTVTLGGALSVGNNPVTLGGTLAVTGTTTMTGTLTAGGFTTAGTMSVGGNTNFNAHVTLGNASSDIITVSGSPTFNAPITVGSNGVGHAITIHSAATGRALTYDPTNDSDGMSKLMFGENMKAQFGTNTSDLAIYNNDTNSFIDAGTTAGHLYIRNRGDQKDIIFQAEDGETNNSYETYFMLDGELSEAGTAGVNYTRWPDKANIALGDVISGELHGGEITVYNKHLNISHMISPAQTEKNINITNYSNDGDINLATDNGSGGSTVYIRLDGGEKKIYLNENIVFDSVTIEGIQTSGESFADNDTSLMTSAAIDDRINAVSLIPFIDGGTNFTDGLIIGHNTHVGTLNAAERNVGVGNNVLQDLTQGDDNTVLGHNAGMNITTGSRNTLIGGGAGYKINASDDCVAIGATALGGINNHNTGKQTIAIGNDTVRMGYSSGSGSISGTTAVGHSAGERNQSFGSTFLGWNAGSTVTGYDFSGEGHDEELHSNAAARCVIIGGNAGTSATSVTNEIVIGFGAKGKGSNTVVLGNNATLQWLPHDNNGVDLGSGALSFKNAFIQGVLNIGDVSGSTYFQLPSTIGNAGQVLKVPSSGNSLTWADDAGALLGIQEGGNFTNSLIVGHDGTGTLDNALGNTGVGVGAMNAVTSGDHNAALGHDALGAITTGSSNIAIGKQALFTSVVDNNNVAIGKDALYSLTNSNTSSPVSGEAENNIAIGWQAGNGITTGSNNIVIGYNADTSSATVNNEIIIGNTDTTHAVIKGLKKEVSNITSNANASRNNIHVFSASSNLTITLPDTGSDPSLIGMSFTFVTKTAPASGNVHKIVCSDTTNESIFGSILATKASSAGSDFMQTDDAAIADGRSSINFNGTTQGGRQGTHITLTCIAADTWLVEGTMRYTGTFASSFANS